MLPAATQAPASAPRSPYATAPSPRRERPFSSGPALQLPRRCCLGGAARALPRGPAPMTLLLSPLRAWCPPERRLPPLEPQPLCTFAAPRRPQVIAGDCALPTRRAARQPCEMTRARTTRERKNTPPSMPAAAQGERASPKRFAAWYKAKSRGSRCGIRGVV